LAQQLVQAAHATHEVALLHPYQTDQISHLIVIGVPSELELLQEAERLTGAGIPLTLFREPDIGNAATALATAPISGEARKLFRHHKLWNPER
jgi:hypothetical protein